MVGLPYDSWIVIVKDVKYKVNEKQFYGWFLKGGLISWDTMVSYGGLKDDHGRLIFQPLSKNEFLVKISITMLSWSKNEKEGKERYFFD